MAHLTGSLNKAEVAMRTEALSLLKRGASINEVASPVLRYCGENSVISFLMITLQYGTIASASMWRTIPSVSLVGKKGERNLLIL